MTSLSNCIPLQHFPYSDVLRERELAGTYMVVLATSFMLMSGSALSGQRRMHGAKTMARELGFMRLCTSTLDTLQVTQQNTCEKHLHLFLSFSKGCSCSHKIWPACLLLGIVKKNVLKDVIRGSLSAALLGFSEMWAHLTRWKMSLSSVMKCGDGSCSKTL